MKRHSKEKGVLDEIAESISDETLISDLSDRCRDEAVTPQVVEVLKDMDSSKYKLHVWEEAAYYLTRIRKKFKSPEEVKTWLCSHLKNHH